MSCERHTAVFTVFFCLLTAGARANPAASAGADGLAAAPDAQAVPTAPAPTDVQASFAAAVKLYKQGDFARALPSFEQLAADTASPNAELYVGHCLVRLDRPVEAHRAFSRVLGSSSAPREDKYDTTREAARLELFALEQRVGKLVLALAELPPGLGVLLDGQPLAPAAFGALYAVAPGEHRLEATAAGREPVLHTFRVAAGETKTLSVVFSKPESGPAPAAAPPPPRARDDSGSTLRLLGFTSLGVGAAGFAVFGVAGLSAKSVRDDLEAACGAAPCSDPAHRDDAARGSTLQTVANAGLVVGLLGAAGGTTLLLLNPRADTDGRAALGLTRGGGVVSYAGSF